MDAGISALAVARSRVVAEPRWSPDGARLGWLEASDGLTELRVALADGSGPPVTVTGALSLGGVGAYRGGMWCWVDAGRVAVATRDGALVVAPIDGAATTVVARDGHAAAPAAGPDGRILFACERDDALDVAETWADARAWPQRWSRADFAWDPAISPDGRRVAWHEWDLAAMSWTASRIVLVDRDEGVPRVVAGGTHVSVGQPRFSPDGRRLAYVSDETGWWNVHVLDVAVGAHGVDDDDDGAARPLLVEPHDHAEPAWGPGQRSFAWSPTSDAIALCRNEDGFARLVVVTLDGTVTDVARGWHHGIEWGAAGIVAVRSGARTPPQVTIVDPTGGNRRVVRAVRPRDSRPAHGSRRWSAGAPVITPSPGCSTVPTPTTVARPRSSSTSTADPPDRRSCDGTAGCVTSPVGASRCSDPIPGAPPASGARSCRTMSAPGATPTSPTSRPRSKPPARRDGAIRRASRSREAAREG